jgi:hypothetical protein
LLRTSVIFLEFSATTFSLRSLTNS